MANDILTSGAFRENTTVTYVFEGKPYHPGADKCWKTTTEGLDRLAQTKTAVPDGIDARVRALFGRLSGKAHKQRMGPTRGSPAGAKTRSPGSVVMRKQRSITLPMFELRTHCLRSGWRTACRSIRCLWALPESRPNSARTRASIPSGTAVGLGQPVQAFGGRFQHLSAPDWYGFPSKTYVTVVFSGKLPT